MAARIVKEQAARWQVISPWVRGDQTAEVVAVEITTSGSAVTIRIIGGRPIEFPLERAKMFLDALRDAVASVETAEEAGKVS